MKEIQNQKKIGAILSYVNIFVGNTVSLLYTPFALRILGQSQYGLFGTASSLTGYLSLLSLGIGGAYIRWNVRYRTKGDVEGERRLNGMYFTMFSIITALVLAVGFVLLFLSDFIYGKSFTSSELYDLKWIIFLNILNTAITMFFTPILMNIIAYEKFLVNKLLVLIGSIVTPLINIVVLLNGGRSVALSWVTFLFTIFNFIVYFVYAIKVLNMRFIFKDFEKKAFKEIFIFSSFLFLNSITELLTDSTDNIILGAVSGTVAVAVYTIGHNFKNYFTQFATSVSGVFAPQVNKMVAERDDNKELVELMTRVGRIQFYIVSLILIGYIAVGKSFINLWAGKDYSSAWLIGLFLLLGTYIPLFQNVGIEIQKAKNKHKFRSVVYFLVAIFNVLLTIPLSMKWAGVGAAFSTFIAMIIGNVMIMNIYYQKGIGLDMKYFWREILKIVPSLIPTIVVCILVYRFMPRDNWWWLIVEILIIVAVYVLSVYFIAMNDYEKNLLLSPIRKIKNKIKSH